MSSFVLLKTIFGVNTLFLPPDNHVGIGNVFHQLADEFINFATNEARIVQLFQSAVNQLQVEQITSSMQQLFYEVKFYSYLQQAVKKDASQAQPLLQVWQGLQGLIKRFAEILVINRRYCSAEKLISNTFISEARKLEHYFDLPDGSKQRVVGEFDCLVFNFEAKRLCVVDLKPISL